MIGDLIRRYIYQGIVSIFCVLEPWIIRHEEKAAKSVAFENFCFSNIVRKKIECSTYNFKNHHNLSIHTLSNTFDKQPAIIQR